MSDIVFIKHIHLSLFANWFENLNESEKNKISKKFPNLESYLGIEIHNPTYDEEKGFEFKIINEERWKKALFKHDFLNNF